MNINDVLLRSNDFKYMLLGRLQSDLYSLGSLWAGNYKEQIEYMVAIWNSLNTKPEWLTKKELIKLAMRFNHKDITKELI